MDTTLQTFLNELLVAVLSVAIPIATRYLVAFVEAKTKAIEADEKYSQWQQSIDAVSDLVTQTVIAINQTSVDALKKANLFSKEEQEKAFNTAFETVNAQISDETKTAITAVYGDFSKWLTNEIEKSVNWNK